MIQKILYTLLFSLILVSISSAQILDYEKDPVFDFEFRSMHLTLELSKDTSIISGVVTWLMSAQTDSINQIRLISVRSNIKSIRIDEIIADFEHIGDTLLISQSEYFQIDELFKLEIVYEANPQFSLYRTTSGTIWSSFLPSARTDLFPSLPHPKIQFTTDIRLILPLEWKGIANGVFVTSTLMPEEKRLYHWGSTVPVSVTDIGIVAGMLEYKEAFIGSRSIRIYTESEGTNTLDKTIFLDSVLEKINRLESVTGKEFPYQSMTFIELPDHQWEVRSSGATLGFLFQNANTIEEQLSRILASQVFGSYYRTPSLSEANHILVLQGYLYSLFSDMSVPDYSRWQEFPEFESETWGIWSPEIFSRSIYTSLEGSFSTHLNKTILSAITELESGAYSWADFQSMHYAFDDLSYPELESRPDLHKEYYTINYDFDEQTNRYSIEFIPEGNYEQRILSLRLRQFSSGNVNEVDYMVSTAGDLISFTSSGFIQNIYVIEADDSLVFTENKPAQFWVYQLRSDSNYERRIESAVGFSRVTDDPDIQLFIQDLIRNEPDEIVKASLVESYGILTRGASGTHQRFIPLLDNPSILIRRAALNALRNYPGNEQVQQAVFRIISLSDDFDFVNHAIEVYRDITDEAEFFSVARSLLIEDLGDLYFTPSIIPLIVTTEAGKQFAPNLMQYLESNYPFYLRNLTLNILKEMEISPSYWLDILPELLNDSDTRVRFIGLDLISKFEKRQVLEILEGRISVEYDVRVLHKVQKLLHNM
jgi:hypothetical protein